MASSDDFSDASGDETPPPPPPPSAPPPTLAQNVLLSSDDEDLPPPPGENETPMACALGENMTGLLYVAAEDHDFTAHDMADC